MATYTTLRYGSTGQAVKDLQTALGFTGKDVDGIFGNKTLNAVKNYQKQNGLTVDGIVGNNTWGALNKSSTTTTSTTQPSPTYEYEEFKYDPYTESDTVKQAQSMLQEHMANKPGEYTSNWQAQLNDTLNKILNREEFSYDLNGDALYQQYKDQYTTQGKQAMMDTMGQAAAMTGGYGNSYAQSVGQQTYQGYLQQLNDKVPELYQIARDQYNQEGQDLYNQAALMAQQEEQEYGRHRDSVSDYYTELDYLTGRADKEAQTDYERWSDKVGMDYNIHSDTQTAGATAKSDANELAMSMLSLGVMPSADILATAGISSADAQAIIKKVAETQSTSNPSNPSNPTPTPAPTPTPGNNVDPNSKSIKSFKTKVDSYTKNWDAVMRHMWGSPKQYIAQQIEESSLSNDEKAYLISHYGITENDLNYKNK